MKITLNGKHQIISDGSTIRELLVKRRLEVDFVVVEVNKVIVPKEEFRSYRIVNDDFVEILRFVGGG